MFQSMLTLISIPSGAIKRIYLVSSGRQRDVFQFLLVRLRVSLSENLPRIENISIPSGAIKSQDGRSPSATSAISIPSGAIKSLL